MKGMHGFQRTWQAMTQRSKTLALPSEELFCSILVLLLVLLVVLVVLLELLLLVLLVVLLVLVLLEPQAQGPQGVWCRV